MTYNNKFTSTASDSVCGDIFVVYIDVHLLKVLQTTSSRVMVPHVSASGYLLDAPCFAVALRLSK